MKGSYDSPKTASRSRHARRGVRPSRRWSPENLRVRLTALLPTTPSWKSAASRCLSSGTRLLSTTPGSMRRSSRTSTPTRLSPSSPRCTTPTPSSRTVRQHRPEIHRTPGLREWCHRAGYGREYESGLMFATSTSSAYPQHAPGRAGPLIGRAPAGFGGAVLYVVEWLL